MKTPICFPLSLALIFSFVVNVVPCGPSYVSPLFTVRTAPEDPYLDYANGRIGIVKPEFHRSVLFAAYRWINGSGLNAEEQKALIDVWNADFNNKDYVDADVAEAVKAWVEKRKDVVGKEEKTPSIYVEREYGGYDFFPNCTKNAFETAAETLSSRISSHGSDNKDVKGWLEAQDAVFSNCSSGKTTPEPLQPGATEWLQKDRAYQIAAASFYSLDYEDAKKRFREIAEDFDSPWRETADYLVARTLIRQASLSKDAEKTKELYVEAEQHLLKFTGGKFADSAERMLGLIKYRLRPEERVRELAQKLSGGGTLNFRQDVIDYTWLMDKFEAGLLKEEENRKRREEEEKKNLNLSPCASGLPANTPCRPSNISIPSIDTVGNSASSVSANTVTTIANAANAVANVSRTTTANRTNDSDLQITIYSTDHSQQWRFYVPLTATDEQAIAEAEKVVGSPLTESMKKRVREARQNAYSERYSSGRTAEYDGGYFGDEDISLSLLPEFLRYEDLTDWLFTYQIADNEAYLYSLNRYKQSQSELWLMTTLSKATRTSAELTRILKAADEASRTSLAYPTIAYHAARISIEIGRTAEARKMIDEAMSRSSDMPISSINEFMKLRLRLAETLEDFLKYSLRKPFAFDWDGRRGTIDDMIAEQKTWYNPEYNKEGQGAYEAEVEKNFEREKQWEDRFMLDSETINLMNQFFPTTVLASVESSEALPDYLRERFAIAVWTRAALFDDVVTANKIAPKLVQYHPELADGMKAVKSAAGPIARQNAVLALIIRNPIFTPFLEDGLGRTDNEVGEFDMNDYWCEPYDEVYDEDVGDVVSREKLQKPKFLTVYQTQVAAAEREKLKKIGNAPTYLGERVLKWARRSPRDRRLPELLYHMHQANGWTKYGCGNNPELQEKLSDLLRRRYPNSEWTHKLNSNEETEN